MQVTNGLCYLTNHVTETMLLNDLRNPGFELCSNARKENQPLSCFVFLFFSNSEDPNCCTSCEFGMLLQVEGRARLWVDEAEIKSL